MSAQWAIVICLLFTGCEKGASPVDPIVYLRNATPQVEKERTIVGAIPGMETSEIQQILLENTIVDTLVFSIHEAGITVNTSHVFTVDKGDFSFKKYTRSDGQFMLNYSKGKGAGPGEIMDPASITVGANGKIGTVDYGNRRITIYDEDTGEEIASFRIKGGFETALLTSSLDKVVIVDTRAETLFNVYSLDYTSTELVLDTMHGRWVQDQENIYGANLGGNIKPHPTEDAYYYLNDYDGWLYGGTFDGEERFLRNTIDNLPLTIVYRGNEKVPGKDDAYWDKSPRTAINGLLSVWDDRIYTSARFETPEVYENPFSIEAYIDVYNATTGDYIESFAYTPIPYCIPQGVYEGDFYFVCQFDDGMSDSMIITRYPVDDFRFDLQG